jgi:hypothetical protein
MVMTIDPIGQLYTTIAANGKSPLCPVVGVGQVRE